MGIEIERKFLVVNDTWRALAEAGKRYEQGYLLEDSKHLLRVRTVGSKWGGTGYLTIKGAGKLKRAEFEYEIPVQDAKELLARCTRSIVSKTRYRYHHQPHRPEGHIWEIDEFHGANAGLVMAEIELTSENEAFLIPGWLGEEVTLDARYTNSSLADSPMNPMGLEVRT